MTASLDLVVGLVASMKGLVTRDPFTLGAFEFTTLPDPMPACESALANSFRAHGHEVATPLMGPGLRVARTFFVGVESREHALKSARLHAQEALVLLATVIPMPLAALELTGPGYTFDLKTAHAQPILPRGPTAMPGGIIGRLDELATHPDLTVNTLLSVHPDNYGELGRAIRRSTHWRHLSDDVEDWTERFLLSWMAAETLTRIAPGEALAGLTAKWLAALGFGAGKYGRQLVPSDAAELVRIPQYRHWSRRLRRLFGRARRARNAIAHAGFRELDIGHYLDAEDRFLLRRVFRLLMPRLTGLALNGLALRVQSVADMWRRYGECFYYARGVRPAVEVRGTIIYSLEQPPGAWDV